MKFEEIIDRHANEYKEYLKGYKQTKDQLREDKASLLQHMKCNEADLPESMRDKLKRDNDDWKEKWGMYGSQFKNMRIAHQKEIDRYFNREELAQDVNKAQDKTKEKGAGR